MTGSGERRFLYRSMRDSYEDCVQLTHDATCLNSTATRRPADRSLILGNWGREEQEGNFPLGRTIAERFSYSVRSRPT